MLRRIKRYLLFGIQYFLGEVPRGLDFTMRDTSLFRTSGGLYHGYSKTSEKHLKEIFSELSFHDEKRLLDVGCGKGVVLKVAAAFPLQKIAGIEIDERLVGIARNNFRVLGLDKKIECIQADAAEFEGYGEYDLFFFFNPFSGSVMEKVVDKLIAAAERNPITVIYHNPVYMQLFEQKAELSDVKKLYDRTKDYDTYIFDVKGKKA